MQSILRQPTITASVSIWVIYVFSQTYAEITFPERLYHLGALVRAGVFFLLAFRVHIFMATSLFMAHCRYFYHFSRTHSPRDIVRLRQILQPAAECTHSYGFICPRLVWKWMLSSLLHDIWNADNEVCWFVTLNTKAHSEIAERSSIFYSLQKKYGICSLIGFNSSFFSEENTIV